MERQNSLKQKGFLIRDLLDTPTSRSSTRSPEAVNRKHDALLARESHHATIMQTISNFNKKQLPNLTVGRGAAELHNGRIRIEDATPASGDKTETTLKQVANSDRSGSPDHGECDDEDDDRHCRRVPIQRPIPGMPNVLLGSPLRIPHLADMYRDPRLFRIGASSQSIVSGCPCAASDCGGAWSQLDQACRAYKGLYGGDQFDLKDSLPVPVPLPFYVRMRSDSMGCDGCFKTKKCRRSRTVFTELQLMGLEKRFDSQKYLSTPDRMDLADKLGLTQIQVKTWYQNRRMKWKKQVLQNGGTEAPTKPKGRPRKVQIDASNDIQTTLRHTDKTDDV